MYLSKIINGKHLLIFNLREKITRYFIKIYLYVHTLQKWPCNEGFDAHNDSRESFSAFRDLQIPILLFFHYRIQFYLIYRFTLPDGIVYIERWPDFFFFVWAMHVMGCCCYRTSFFWIDEQQREQKREP